MRRPSIVKGVRTYVCLRARSMVVLYPPGVPYGWHTWRRESNVQRDAGEARDRAAAPDPRDHTGLYRGAWLSAVGTGDRRARRAFILLDDSRSSEGARAARPDLARSYQAAGAAFGNPTVRAGCHRGT